MKIKIASNFDVKITSKLDIVLKTITPPFCWKGEDENTKIKEAVQLIKGKF